MRARGPDSIPSGLEGVLWSLIIVAVSVAGGLAAATLVDLPSVWIAVAIPAVIGSVIEGAVLYRRPGSAGRPGNGPEPAEPCSAPRPEVPSGRHDAHSRGHQDPAPDGAAAESAAIVQVLPVPSASVDAPWWTAARALPQPKRSNAGLVAAPDLSTFLASALIAQCPRCGAFKLDIKPAPARWACRCASCEHTWTWQPGTAWPQVRVAPRRRIRPAAPDGNSP